VFLAYKAEERLGFLVNLLLGNWLDCQTQKLYNLIQKGKAHLAAEEGIVNTKIENSKYPKLSKLNSQGDWVESFLYNL